MPEDRDRRAIRAGALTVPIRPENRERYPPDWKAISKRIRNDRARGRCECRGECGYDHTLELNRIAEDDGVRSGIMPERDRCIACNGLPHPVTGSTVVLTVAHLDHTPENCADENLRAMCQRCHLAYDKEEHDKTRRENNNRDQLKLF